jgi:ferrous iron transport protein B
MSAYTIALAGNPNTGKSTVFNALTGLRQHTGNWPGKTVARATGTYLLDGTRYRVVDLPGTYSLVAGSVDEEVARDFLLFDRPDVTVIVLDATRLERNLHLALQVLEITSQVVVCVNLMDEAARHGISIDLGALETVLGVPVVGSAARSGKGMNELRAAIDRVARANPASPGGRTVPHAPPIEAAIAAIVPAIEAARQREGNTRWIALRLLHADERVEASFADFPGVIEAATAERRRLGTKLHDRLAEGFHAEAARIAARVVRATRPTGAKLDQRLDGILTSRVFGFPIMLGLLAVVFWLTIAGANVPSALLASFLIDTVHPLLRNGLVSIGSPVWLVGFLVDGVYLATAWVVSVMLPPMAIFFPLFTLLEDLGYLPRVAFNLDRVFKACGAHGKQALTMCMGFGCNAAGVVATRVIDSPRERLVAILTNNFSLCNGRWPTQILVASVFVAAVAPEAWRGSVATLAVVGVALTGILAMFGASWLLSRTVLKGEATTFSLELPPYRPPRILQTLYTSLIDRTLIVLWRAVIFAAPAGALTWLSANVDIGGRSLAQHLVSGLDPLGLVLGLNGVILLAYILAIPANEIVIPTVLMLTVHTTAALTGQGAGAGVMFEADAEGVRALLVAGGWTMLTGINLMLFSLLHNPCSTTIYTIYRETGSVRWTTVAALLPVALGVTVCFLVAQFWRLAGG